MIRVRLLCTSYVKSKHLIRDVAFLRHAQSNYNLASNQYLLENNIKNLSWDQICQLKDFNQQVNFNPKFIDSDLSPKGSLQCYQLKQKYEGQYFDYDLILVSPLTRALRTCRNTFYYYPVKKVVLPELTEALRYACDISSDIQDKKQQFKEMDFSKFTPNNNLWFLQTQSSETRQLIQNQMVNKSTLTQIQKLLIEMMHKGQLYESDQEVRLRASKIKQIISQYRTQYNKIIIITHHYIIQCMLATAFRDNHQPIITTEDEVPNARPFKVSLQQINKVT